MLQRGCWLGLALCGSWEELVAGNREPTSQRLLLFYSFNLKQLPTDQKVRNSDRFLHAWCFRSPQISKVAECGYSGSTLEFFLSAGVLACSQSPLSQLCRNKSLHDVSLCKKKLRYLLAPITRTCRLSLVGQSFIRCFELIMANSSAEPAPTAPQDRPKSH